MILTRHTGNIFIYQNSPQFESRRSKSKRVLSSYETCLFLALVYILQARQRYSIQDDGPKAGTAFDPATLATV